MERFVIEQTTQINVIKFSCKVLSVFAKIKTDVHNRNYYSAVAQYPNSDKKIGVRLYEKAYNQYLDNPEMEFECTAKYVYWDDITFCIRG